MQNLVQTTAPTSPFIFLVEPSANASSGVALRAPSSLADHQFIEMLDAYRQSGGLARLQELAGLRGGGAQVDIANLANCISRRELICFEWQTYAWLPLFQFDLSDMTLRPQLQRIVAELSCIYNPWEVAFWFTQPKPWLSHRAPADTAASEFATLLQHARADRPGAAP